MEAGISVPIPCKKIAYPELAMETRRTSLAFTASIIIALVIAGEQASPFLYYQF